MTHQRERRPGMAATLKALRQSAKYTSGLHAVDSPKRLHERLYFVEEGITLARRPIAIGGVRTALITFDADVIDLTHRRPVEGEDVRVIVDRLSGIKLRSFVANLLSAGAVSVRAIRVSRNSVEMVSGIAWLAGDIR